MRLIYVGEWSVPELRRLVVGYPSLWLGFEPRSGHVVFVVDKVALGQVSAANFHSTHCSTFNIIYHPGLVQ
jgi:hypothetical protein